MHTPSETLLKNYADVLIKFALNSGAGVKPGDVIYLSVPESAKPLLWQLQKSVLESGSHYITNFIPDGEDRRTMGGRLFYEHASEEQLSFLPDKYFRGLIDQVDHWVAIIADDDPHALKGIDSEKLMLRQRSRKPVMEWRNAKEHAGELTWTLALYATPAMAKEAGLSLEDYWSEIIHACYLEDLDPIQSWQSTFKEIERVKQTLNDLPIDKLHVEAPDTDLWITLGQNRLWHGGGGRNIPSYEIFTSPDCRFTQGHISFSEPLYLYGQKSSGIKLWFENGRVTKVEAQEGQELLEKMIKSPNGDRVGEFSLTDSRLSRITKFMANTLFDENVGGQYGNTHLALGMSYLDTYDGDISKIKLEDWESIGMNDSVVHTDIMSTTDRTVTATLKDGTEKIIYQNGQFTV